MRNTKFKGRAQAVALGVAAIAAVVGAGIPALATPSFDAAVVHTDGGSVRGAVTSDSVTFSGIPYAAPPVGERRWRPPQPAGAWLGVRDATRAGNVCPQLSNGQLTGSEDCLNLDVTVPPTTNRSVRRPVMVWIHGGGFVSGAASRYDAARLVNGGDVVTVSMNYRLGPLGFLAHPALGARDPYSGNYGLADQQAALRWVRRNIAAFGGDPRNVTVFGQSAGGFSVCAHLAAPLSRGLFDKAIVQSGPCGATFPTRQVAEARGVNVSSDLGCPADGNAALACLRAKPLAHLVGVGYAQVFPVTAPTRDRPWSPVVGTPALPSQPLDALRRGTAAPVPLLQGSNRDEMRPFVGKEFDLRGTPVTAAQYATIVRQAFGGDADAVLTRYPVGSYASPGIALATVLTDWGGHIGACPVLPADDAAARHAPVYAYEFNEDHGQSLGGLPLGTPHAAELSYLFGGSFGVPYPPTADRDVLSQRMIAYWARFARTGDPNGPGAPHWPAYRPGHPTVLSLAAGPRGIGPVSFGANHQCSFWLARTTQEVSR